MLEDRRIGGMFWEVSSPSPMHVVCTIDDQYARHCAVMLLTLRDANPTTPLHVYVVHAGLRPQEASKLLRCMDGRLTSLSLIQVDAAACDEFPLTDHVSAATYLRLLLPSALPAGVDRFLFLDSDLIVNDSLEELWATSLQGRPLAAVSSVGNAAHRARLHMRDEEDYFNAGVLLMDLNAWRARDIIGDGAAFVRRHPERVLMWDQDILNQLFRGEWLPLAARWNAVTAWWLDAQQRDFDPTKGLVPWTAGRPPAIVHFAGGGACKPWHHECPHPHRHRYREFAARTPWRGSPLEGAPTIAERAKARLRPWLRPLLRPLRSWPDRPPGR